MINKLDHIGIVVENLDDSLKKYEKMFHVKATHIETIEYLDLQIAFLPIGEVMIELLQPLTPGEGIIGKLLKEQGEGFHHMAYRVDNIERMLAEMKQAGVRLMDETPRAGAAGSRIAFINPEETNNVLMELLERGEDIH